MADNILNQYYEGILNQIESEVKLINNIFEHQGLKGEGNENALKNLLIKFLPKKYGIGTGIVIDRNGKQSKQCDIIIYDNQNYPELLSLTSVKLFPVDLVYAVIEVKTKLDSEKSKIAIDNIKSVKKLDFIKASFRTIPTEPINVLSGDTEFFGDQDSSPPIGIVFAYKSSTNNLDTFINWFSANDSKLYKEYPSHVFCLDQCLLIIGHQKRDLIPYIYPLITDDEFHTVEDEDEIEINGEKMCMHNGKTHPFIEYKKNRYIINQSKSLLNFILSLYQILNIKKLDPNIDFREHYLPLDLKIRFSTEKGKLVYIPEK
jgi:hypothetical protein